MSTQSTTVVVMKYNSSNSLFAVFIFHFCFYFFFITFNRICNPIVLSIRIFNPIHNILQTTSDCKSL